MTTKKFIIRITVQIILFIFISTIAMTVIQSPLIENDIALGQMQNSDEAFILYEMYNKLAPVVEAIYVIISLFFVIFIIYQVEKFIETKIKEKKSNEQKENQ